MGTVPHWKALRYGKDGSRELSCGSASSILKSNNLLHKRGFVKIQWLHTVNLENGEEILLNAHFLYSKVLQVTFSASLLRDRSLEILAVSNYFSPRCTYPLCRFLFKFSDKCPKFIFSIT